ncbi:MAG: c-type cytochrome [Gammaproteobacteria bacterium]|nr:c-type cytochrome [Gammaproteobacteria bacterium]
MKAIVTCMAVLALATGGNAIAGDAAAGKTVYNTKGCAGCHGPAAVSMLPQYPNLAGQKAQYAVLALKAYKDGQRNSTNAAAMKPMAMMLSDADMDNVAAYLESLK